MNWRKVRRFTDTHAVMTLLGLCLLLKAVVLLQQPILARDGIHYIRFAHKLTQQPFPQVLREEPYHPGYPLVIAAFAQGYQLFHSAELTPVEWQWSAHWAASLAGVLLVIPLYGLARCFFSLGSAWISVALFSILPATVQSTTDTLAESWLLLFLFSALWCLVVAVRQQRLVWFALAGLFSGMGYLFRLEALVIPVVGLIVLLTRRWWGQGQMMWQTALRCSLVLMSCFILTIVPYALTIGKLSARPSAGQLLQVLNTGDNPYSIAGPQYLFASRLQDGVNGLRIEAVQLWDAIKLVGSSLGKAGHYFIWPLAVVGIFAMWRGMKCDLGLGVLCCVALVQVLMLLRLAYSAGYTSERHALPLVALACMLASMGLIDLHTKMVDFCRRYRIAAGPGCISLVLVLICCVPCLPKALQTLHASQEGHRQAGLWLAQQLTGNDKLVDPYQWASFYAGRETGWQLPQMFADHRTIAIVDPRDADLNRREEWRKAGVLQDKGVILFSWPAEKQPKLLIKQGYTK